jgi:hypothetical protein
VKSEANLRQIGLACASYRDDHGGDFPDTLSQLLLCGDISQPGLFVSPRRQETPATGATTRAIIDQIIAGGHLSYLYLGRGLTTATTTPGTIIAYEIPGTPNDAYGVVVFADDAHTEIIDHGRFVAMLARVANGTFPVAIP